MSKKKKLTTSAGSPTPNNQKSITAGHPGPVLMQDYQLIEKLAHQTEKEFPSVLFMLKAGALLELLQ